MAYIYIIIFWILTLLAWLQFQTIITHLHSEQAMNQEKTENQSLLYCESNIPVELWIAICSLQIQVVTHHHPFLSYSFPFFRRHFSLLTDEHVILPLWRHSITTYSSMATQMGRIFPHNTKATWRCSAKKILKRITDCQYSFFWTISLLKYLCSLLELKHSSGGKPSLVLCSLRKLWWWPSTAVRADVPALRQEKQSRWCEIPNYSHW